MQTGMSILQSGSSAQLALPEPEGDDAIRPRKQPTYEPGREQAQAARDLLAQKRPMTFETRKKGLARTKKPFDSRLRSEWNKDDVIFSLEAKIEQYTMRHGTEKGMTRDRVQRADDGGVRQKELAILDRMKKDAEAGALLLPVEEAASSALRSGFREYVDYTVDEVERYNCTLNVKRAAEFDWAGCGDVHDVPSLRRCQTQNRVDGAPSHQAGLGQGHDNMFAMDFLRDFCKRQYPEEAPPEDYKLQRMALASQERRPPVHHRADNGMPLFEEEEYHSDDEDIRLPSPNLLLTAGSFGAHTEKGVVARDWAVEYSVV
jgi:hypothetical protein